MLAFIIRRLLLTIPTVFGILLLTFVLFSMVAKNPARMYVGRNATQADVDAVAAKMGLNKPRFVNVPEYKKRGLAGLFDSQFCDLARFKFAPSMRYDKPVLQIIAEKVPISLSIQLPALFISLGLQLAFALIVSARRGSAIDYVVTGLCVASLALPVLVIYILMQWLLGAKLSIFPVAGWENFPYSIQYAALPILCVVFLSLGGGIRFYRTVMLEEMGADYVRTARAKGVSASNILLIHVLRNVMIPVVTQTITTLPFLITGAVILERLFQIPGIGGLLVDSIFRQDRSIVLAVTYITALLYCGALLVSDILYTIVDPRVTLN